MIDFLVYFILVVLSLLFLSCVLLAIYLVFLLMISRGFKISPTVTSNSKSIKKMAKYIKRYIEDSNKKNVRILDIGSGYGTLLFKINKYLKKRLNKKVNVEFVGYEISKIIYTISKLRNRYKNITLIHDDINNMKDFNYDIVITFILAKQQKLFLDIYRKFPKGTTIIANSLPIPFEENDNFKLIRTIKVHYHWNIYIYQN